MAAVTELRRPVDDPHAELHGWLAHASHLLPDQGPIGIFVHHNTLHGVQHLPFAQAVTEAARHTGARPWLTEARFRDELRNGRIELRDLEEALDGDDASTLALGLTERAVRLASLRSELVVEDANGLRHRLSHGQDRPDRVLWDACERRLAARPPRPAPVAQPLRRHRDALVALGEEDTDLAVHAELQRWCAAFLDQGQAIWPMPGRHHGFLRAVEHLYRSGAGLPPGARGLRAELDGPVREAEDVVVAALDALGVVPEDRAAFVEATVLALPGWSGMFSRLERRPEEAHHPPHARLVDLLAVRLRLERHLIASVCHRAGLPVALRELFARVPESPRPDPIVDVALLHGLAVAAGADARAVQSLDDRELDALFTAVDRFPALERRRVFQEAYEGWYRRRFLHALAARRRTPRTPAVGRPKAAFVFCIDEREESIRRAVEELDPGFLTFGAAGFFGVAIDYQGLDDHAPGAHCPAVVVPAHEVHEAPVYPHRERLEVRRQLRATWHQLQRRLRAATRSLGGGWISSLVLGPWSGLRVAGHVMAPRRAMSLSNGLSDALLPMPLTRLHSVRDSEVRSDRGKLLGFSTDEKVDRVVALLTNLGLVRDLPPVVVILGHGSTSLNNPHESAHDCGACGGRRGGANARLSAEMANRPEVRAGVRARGIPLPDDVWFVGALHDTSDDSVRYYDLDRLPATHTEAFDVARRALEHGRRENARERARRFDDAPLGLSADEALAHVEGRASSLAQPRPEYGHCTNAIAVVGRRELTRGLFMDRRAFLVSYDPSIDPNHAVLERILAAVGPVGAGINLEYWFSSVDNEVYGCGTKLPHNVTGLLGVMNGHQSDLRTGLPWQMVEIHEPMRLLLVVEATPEALLGVAGRQAEVRQLVVNGWIQLVSVHPETGELHRFHQGAFVPVAPEGLPLPRVARSVDWYGKSRAHLPFAMVDAGV